MFLVKMYHTFSKVQFLRPKLCYGLHWLYLYYLQHSLRHPRRSRVYLIKQVDSKERIYQAVRKEQSQETRLDPVRD